MPDILCRIEAYGQEVAARLQPHLVLLFGSFARGDVHEASDVDILVVADFQEAFLDRITVLQKLDRWHLPLEPWGLTPQEFAEMKAKENPVLLQALEEGKALYPRPKGKE